VGAAAAATIALLPVLQSIDLSVGPIPLQLQDLRVWFLAGNTLSILPMCLDHLLKSSRLVVDEVARAGRLRVLLPVGPLDLKVSFKW